MNQRGGIDRKVRRAGAAPEWVDAAAAARLLDVKRATLYAYVSRGLVKSRAVAGGRERLYQRADLLALRARRDARSGHGPVAAGALRWGEPVLDSSITDIRADGPAYRGRPVLELVEAGVSFERAAELLWSGTLPERASWPRDEPARSPRVLRGLLPASARPLDGMALGLATAALHAGALTPDTELLWVRRSLGELAVLAALPRGQEAVARARRESTVARRLLVALGGRPAPRALRLLEAALVLCADHELNASTFACRVALSAGSDVPRALVAAMATLSGTLHGGTTDHIERLVREVGAPEHAVRAVASRVRQGQHIPGFGHPLYPDGDPRARPLLDAVCDLHAAPLALRTLLALIDAMDLAGAEPPSVDAALVAVSSALGLVPGAALAIFALGRSAGWVAHAREQRAQGVLLRPRARYVSGA
jgi:citrate synthase